MKKEEKKATSICIKCGSLVYNTFDAQIPHSFVEIKN